jgi:hypothetical protein
MHRTPSGNVQVLPVAQGSDTVPQTVVVENPPVVGDDGSQTKNVSVGLNSNGLPE